MDISKEKARELIFSVLASRDTMPIYDQIIYDVVSETEFKLYSFRELLKYVYEL